MLAQQRILGFIMVLSVVMISPVLPYLGIRGIFLAVAFVAALVVVFRVGDMPIRGWFLGITVTALLLSCVSALYWMDLRYVLAPIFLVFSLFLIQLADERALDTFLSVATALMVVVLIGSIIGVVLAMSGVQPLFEIPNNDGRPNYFFYTTFTNSWWGSIIRPSGIYDEAGALSFMVCSIAALRSLRGRDSKVTWILLGLGFVTLSLAHLIYVFFHVLAERLRFRNIAGIVVTLLPLILLAGYLGGYDIVEKRLLDRVTITEAGRLAGDNRTQRLVNAAEHLADNPKSVLFGAHPSCRFDYLTCKERFPLMGENPLSPLAFQGILLSWPYYLALGALFLAPLFGRQYLVSFGIGALFLQRPYLLDMGYSLVGCLVLVATLHSIAAKRSPRAGMPNAAAGFDPVLHLRAK